MTIPQVDGIVQYSRQGRNVWIGSKTLEEKRRKKSGEQKKIKIEGEGEEKVGREPGTVISWRMLKKG